MAPGLRVDRRELVDQHVAEARPAGAGVVAAADSIWPLWAAIATTIMLICSIFSPWAVVWGSVPMAVALIGWFWPKGTPEDLA